MTLKATEVFVPGAYPNHTYVPRSADGLEKSLADALNTPGQIISLSGPSKSGKTVLVEKVVGKELISISGASIQHPDDVWGRVLDWMDVPTSTSRTEATGTTLGGEIGGKGSIGLPLVAKGELKASATVAVADEAHTETTHQRRGLTQVVSEIADSDFVILLDDFHYMQRDVQNEVAKSLKEATRLGVKIITAAVSHRGDDVVRANPELRGRVKAIDLHYWKTEELQRIADTGFKLLNANFDSSGVKTFVDESAGSPQLMQLMCLQSCFVTDLREKAGGFLPRDIPVNTTTLKNILEQTSTTTDFRSLVDVLNSGPRTRGTERKTYKLRNAPEGDVYRVMLTAVAHNPPRLSFPYEELLKRTNEVCLGDTPVGSSVTGTCLHMSKLALEKFPNERAVDWDEQKQVFDIPDPYLLFYLRWSGRLSEST